VIPGDSILKDIPEISYRPIESKTSLMLHGHWIGTPSLESEFSVYDGNQGLPLWSSGQSS
jgi:hypothetical protein